MARLPKFLKLSAAKRFRLALPATKLSLVVFSCTLAIAGMGAFVVTLPSLKANESQVDAVKVDDTVSIEKIEESNDSQDAANDGEQESGEKQETDASASSSIVAGSASSSGAVSSGTDAGAGRSSSSERSSSSGSSDSSAGASASGTAGGSASGSTSSSGGSNNYGGTGTSGSQGSSDSNSSGSSDDSSNTLANDPFSRIPTAEDEEELHAFLVGWYNMLPECESEAANGISDTSWSGYYAVRDHVSSNYSKWKDAQSNLIGTFRCIAWYAESQNEQYLNEYYGYKNAVSL